MPINDDKVMENILKNFDTIPKASIKDFLERYMKKAYYYDSKPAVHVRRKLKDGTIKTYYMFPIPSDAFKYGKLNPETTYRIELYPLEEEEE